MPRSWGEGSFISARERADFAIFMFWLVATLTMPRKQPAAAKGAGGDKPQLAGFKMASVDRRAENSGENDESRESQSWARSAPADPLGHCQQLSEATPYFPIRLQVIDPC